MSKSKKDQPDESPAPAESEDVNTISGLPTEDTPPESLPTPSKSAGGPIPVPNPPGANPPHHSVTTPIQYPPYTKVSDDPPAGADVLAAPETGQFTGQPKPPETAADVEVYQSKDKGEPK